MGGERGNTGMACAHRPTLLALPTPPRPPNSVLAWVEEHKAAFPGNAALQAALDEWTAAYEAAEAAAAEAAAAAAAGDGWTVVVRHGASGVVGGMGLEEG